MDGAISQALPPIYPLRGLTEADARMAYLERQIMAADRMLARHHSDGIEAVRVRLEREYDALYLAVTIRREYLPGLPLCRQCGKIAHATRSSAEQHAWVFQVLDKRQDGRRVDVFWCRFEGASWHVGHSSKGRCGG